MLYNLAQYLVPIFGPARLLQSNAVLICLSLYAGFFLTSLLLPKFYKHLPCDRGREFTIHAEAAKGKPTGAGVVFITFFVLITLVFAPMNALQVSIVVLTWVTMLTGFFDDRSLKGWGEYRKAALDLLICLAATAAMLFLRKGGINQEILFWLPFASKQIAVHPLVFTVVSTVLLWASINTTNCTDGLFHTWSQRHCRISAYSGYGKRRFLGNYHILSLRSFNGLFVAQRFSKQSAYGRCRKPRARLFYWLCRYDKRQSVLNSCNFFYYNGQRRNGTFESRASTVLQNQDFYKHKIPVA